MSRLRVVQVVVNPFRCEPVKLCLEASAAQLYSEAPERPAQLEGPACDGQHILGGGQAEDEQSCRASVMQSEGGRWLVFTDQTGNELGRVAGHADLDPEQVQAVALRWATEEDLRQRDRNREEACSALELFRELALRHGLVMRPVDAHLRFDRAELCFYFVSESRMNFRALHRSLSLRLNMRVAIRQVGVRDYARMLGGIGACGRVLCCTQFLRELKPITLRMARQQSLFVEPNKISGLCGKLLCCLGFEESNVWESDERARAPKAASRV